MDIWNKFIQNLLIAGTRDSVFLAYALVGDEREVYGYTLHTGPFYFMNLNLPLLPDNTHVISREYDSLYNMSNLFGSVGDIYVRRKYEQRKIEGHEYME